MAADNLTNPEASKAQAIIDHARQLELWSKQSLSNTSHPFPDPEICFESLPLARKNVSPQECLALHEVGVQLWNACCSFGRDAEDEKHRKLNAKARAFAYLVLESALNCSLPTSNDKPSHHPGRSLAQSLLRIAMRAAKECLAYDLIDLAGKIIEQLAKQQDRLGHDHVDGDSMTDEQHQSRADFLLLRITHAWKQGRLDVAEHFHATLEALAAASTTSWADRAADLYYEISSYAFNTSRPDLAVEWLRRASSALKQANDHTRSFDNQELDMNISHTLVRALLGTDEPEAGDEALQRLDMLKRTYGQRLPVMLLELEIISKDPSPNADAYFAAVSKIMRSVHLFEQNHKLIMHYLHRLHTLSTTRALRALKNYIVQRLVSEDNRDYLESAIVTLIWMAVSPSDTSHTVTILSEDLDVIHKSWRQILSPGAAHAAALLIWKCINNLPAANNAATVAWCQIGLHALLADVGEHNIAKLQRKLISHYVQNGNFEAAQPLHAQLSPLARNNTLSNYLGYVIALNLHDDSAADSAISYIISASQHDHQMLLACVGETMKCGSRKRGALLMQRVLDKFGYELPTGIHKCALLRCTARLHLSVLDEATLPSYEHTYMLCSIFRAAAHHTDKYNGPEPTDLTSQCPLEECAWFERTSFNVALQHAEQWPSKAVIDLLAHSSAIIYPKNVSMDHKSQQARHRLNVAFLQAIVLVKQARSWASTNTVEDIPRTSYHARSPPHAARLQCHLYENVIMRYHQLRSAISSNADVPLNDEERANIKAKSTALLPLAFEGQLFTTLTGTLTGVTFTSLSLDQLIDAIPILTESSKPYSLFADLILSSATQSSTALTPSPVPAQMPTSLSVQHAIALLGRLIAAMRRHDTAYDIVKAARWIRCVVQLVLDSRSQSGPARIGDVDSATSPDGNLQLIAPIVAEATQLARSSVVAAKHRRHHQNANADSGAQAPVSEEEEEEEVQLYPSDELQWLSTVLFNLAVDLYVAEKGVAAQEWARRAVEVAEAMGAVERAEMRGGGGGGVVVESEDDDEAGERERRGEGTNLVTLLREKGRRVGWEL